METKKKRGFYETLRRSAKKVVRKTVNFVKDRDMYG